MTQKNKKLLSEGQALRFMKLANISNLSENFVKENFVEEEATTKATEGAKLSQTPVKQGGNKTMAQESVQKEEESLEEGFPPAEETPPEAPVADGPPEMGHAEPDGDEAIGEPMIQDLVKAIADAITAKTGVTVDVSGAGDAMGGEEMPPEDGGELPPPAEEPEGEMAERKGHRDHTGTRYDHDGEAVKENKQKLKEDFSEAPKVTKQNQSAQGSVKDPSKSEVRVQGVEKPESMGSNSYPHKMKALEEKITKNILSRLMEEFKKAKAPLKETKKPVQPAKK